MTRPRPTRRGYVVIGVLVLGVLMGVAFGTRSLDVVVVTGLSLLAVTALDVTRLARPEADRNAPRNGAAGDTLQVELRVDAERPVTAVVTDRVERGMEADSRFETIADGRTLRYDLHLRRRGVRTLGPLTVAVTDVFGLWQRRFDYSRTSEVVVYPRIRPLYSGTGLLSGYLGLAEERGQFDGIRQYERGDALRNVNWKASAKRPEELIVTEYAGEGATTSVMIEVEAGRGRADAAAETAASLAMHLFSGGLSVGLATSETRVEPGVGDDHRNRLLEALARLDAGAPRAPATDESSDPDVTVRAPANANAVIVEAGDGRHRFEELIDPDPDADSAGTASAGTVAGGEGDGASPGERTPQEVEG
jgi:uncharacterized protein (DUF58 family)